MKNILNHGNYYSKTYDKCLWKPNVYAISLITKKKKKPCRIQTDAHIIYFVGLKGNNKGVKELPRQGPHSFSKKKKKRQGPH